MTLPAAERDAKSPDHAPPPLRSPTLASSAGPEVCTLPVRQPAGNCSPARRPRHPLLADTSDPALPGRGVCDRPRPLLAITGPAPWPREARMRDSHPGRGGWGAQRQPGTCRRSEDPSLLSGSPGPPPPRSKYQSFSAPPRGSRTQVPRKVYAKVGYISASGWRRSAGRGSRAQEPRGSPSSPQPTPRPPGAMVTLPGAAPQ